VSIAPGLSQTTAGLRAWNDKGIGKGGARRSQSNCEIERLLHQQG